MHEQRFLRVNLSDGPISLETIPEETTRLLIGGRGFGASYLCQEQKPNVVPLGEDNKLLMLTGPLAGTAAQSASRWLVCTRSPLAGAYSRSVARADFAAISPPA